MLKIKADKFNLVIKIDNIIQKKKIKNIFFM